MKKVALFWKKYYFYDKSWQWKMYHRPPMYIHIGYTLSPKKEVGVGEEESSGIGEVEVVVWNVYGARPRIHFTEQVETEIEVEVEVEVGVEVQVEVE